MAGRVTKEKPRGANELLPGDIAESSYGGTLRDACRAHPMCVCVWGHSLLSVGRGCGASGMRPIVLGNALYPPVVLLLNVAYLE
jgi:hypothetical protein